MFRLGGLLLPFCLYFGLTHLFALDLSARSSAITRTDLIASAERIYYRYLLSGAEKEIYLPSSLRIHDFPINSGTLPHVEHETFAEEADFLANIPDLFVSQKEYVYRR